MIAWDLAHTVARRTAGPSGGGGPLPVDVAALAGQAEAAVVAYTRLVPAQPLPGTEAVGRAAWAAANVDLLRDMLQPVAHRLDEQASGMPAALRGVAGNAMAVEIGGVVGYLGRRVLGQYEIALTADVPPPPRLQLVVPNLRLTAERLGAPLEDLVAWVMVHEVTHAVQFASVPWLRGHLGGMLEELLASAGAPAEGDGLRLPTLDGLRAAAGRAREGGLLTLVAGPERLAVIERIQATMALVEGHAEHVMDAAGAGLVRGLPELRAGLERRRQERSTLTMLIERVLGLEMKLRQYREGKAFCDAVVAQAGVEGLNLAWSAPELVPTGPELADPVAWLRRASRA